MTKRNVQAPHSQAPSPGAEEVMQIVGVRPEQYPAEEEFVVQLLVRQIAHAKRWIDVAEAADAIFHVQLLAKGARDEKALFERESGLNAAQSEVIR